MNEHSSRAFDSELTRLSSHLAAMAALVEEQFQDSIRSIVERDSALAEQVVARDDEVDRYEIEIDDDIAHVIARRQPTAGDLRLVLGVGKIVVDLERVGDKARKIARLGIAIDIEGDADRQWLDKTQRLADETVQLIARAMRSFGNADTEPCVELMRDARRIVKASQKIADGLVRTLGDEPARIEHRLNMLTITRSVDRVADHAGNIAEHLLYIIRGTDVRHATIAEIEREIAPD